MMLEVSYIGVQPVTLPPRPESPSRLSKRLTPPAMPAMRTNRPRSLHRALQKIPSTTGAINVPEHIPTTALNNGVQMPVLGFGV